MWPKQYNHVMYVYSIVNLSVLILDSLCTTLYMDPLNETDLQVNEGYKRT